MSYTHVEFMIRSERWTNSPSLVGHLRGITKTIYPGTEHNTSGGAVYHLTPSADGIMFEERSY